MSEQTVSASPAADAGNVLPMRRPPIRQTRVIRGAADRTFEVFTRRLAEWWPLVPFSFGQERVRAVRLEERVGGHVHEVWDDGTTRPWGTLVEWEPPHAFTMTWEITPRATEVALTFTPLAASLTRVDLEHRGWERLSEEELGQDCALPGGYLGGSFQRGWTEILGRFEKTMEEDG